MCYKVVSSYVMLAQVILPVTIQDLIIWNKNNKVTWPPALILLLISVLILRKEICRMSYLICTKCSGASPEPSLGTTVHDFSNMLCKWFINWKGSQYHSYFLGYISHIWLGCFFYFYSIHLPRFHQQKGKWLSEPMSCSLGSASLKCLYEPSPITHILHQLSISLFKNYLLFSQVSYKDSFNNSLI